MEASFEKLLCGTEYDNMLKQWQLCKAVLRINIPKPSLVKQNILATCKRYSSERHILPRQTVRGMYDKQKQQLGPMSWFLLVIPVSAFALGTWQVKRKKWKEELLEDLAKRTSLEPVDLPYDLSEIEAMEYHPVRVQGTFDHSKELLIGPRSLLKHGESVQSQQGILSSGQSGYQVVTPFTLADRDLTILVNRGWVSMKQKLSSTRPDGQVAGQVEVIGILRLTEHRQPLTPENRPGSGLWLYRDIDKMAELVGCQPVFLDASAACTVPGGPVGGQTRISLRNEHLSYVLTWYGLSAATGYMWVKHFLRRAPL